MLSLWTTQLWMTPISNDSLKSSGRMNQKINITKVFNMARAKKVKVNLFNEKKEEIGYDFGEVRIPDSWDEVTLEMMCNLWKISNDKKDRLEEDKKKAKQEKKEAPDETLDIYNVTDKDILKTFSTIDPDKIDLLPVELYEQLMGHLSFTVTPYEAKAPSKYIEIDGKTFLINDMETLKVKEYKDSDTVIRNNPTDYPSLLAVLCRQKTGTKTDNATGLSWDVNEDYTEEFANKIFDARREMFAKLPIADAMPLVSFFLLKGISSSKVSQKSLMTLAEALHQLAENLENSVDSMDLSIWSKVRVKRKLRKYRKQINNILSNT